MSAVFSYQDLDRIGLEYSPQLPQDVSPEADSTPWSPQYYRDHSDTDTSPATSQLQSFPVTPVPLLDEDFPMTSPVDPMLSDFMMSNWFTSKGDVDPQVFHPKDISLSTGGSIPVIAGSPNEHSAIQSPGEWSPQDMARLSVPRSSPVARRRSESDFNYQFRPQYTLHRSPSDVHLHTETMTLSGDQMLVPYRTEAHPYTHISTPFLSGPYVSTSNVLPTIDESSAQFPTYDVAPSPTPPSVVQGQSTSVTISHPYVLDAVNNFDPSQTDTSPIPDPSEVGMSEVLDTTSAVVKREVTTVPMDHAADERRRRPATHQCPYCRKKLTTKAGLKNHINAHLGVKNFKCKTCDRAFVTQWDAQRHERTQHSPPKNLL